MLLSPMAFVIHWPKVARRGLRILAVVVTAFMLSWLCLAWYVNAHRQEIIAKIRQHMSAQMRGELSIGSGTLSLSHAFPNVSLSLNDVSLRDSLWTQHRHSLLEAKNIYVSLNLFALFSRRVEVRNITAAHGTIFLFTDTNGYSNSYLLNRRDTTRRNRPALADAFGLEDMHLWFVNARKQKLFHLLIKDLEGTTTRSSGKMNFHIAGSAHVFGMAFSTLRGAYLKNRDLEINTRLEYNIREKHLHIADQPLGISGTPITFGGDFYFNREPAAFAIHLGGRSIPYRTALSWTSENIQRVLQPYDFKKPVSLDISVSGEIKYHSIPLIKILYPIKDNTLVTPLGNIEHLSYSGEYYNEAARGNGHGDNNSLLAMYRFSGEWRGIPFSGDTLEIVDLLQPIIKTRVRSSFPVTALNDIIGGNTISFQKGKAEVDIRYTGAITPEDTAPHSINGYLRVSDAGLSYLPRNFVFTDVNATLLFDTDNLFFRNITMRSRQSSLSMEGDALHFLRLYFSDPGKATVAWRIRGPFVNLNDFTGFIVKRKTAVRHRAAPFNAVTRIGYQLDRVLDAASFSLDARINRILYKSFNAEDVIAQATVAQSGVVLQQVQIRQGGGSLHISGNIDQAAPNNPFHVKTDINHVNVSKLFSSFDNFGQSAIGSENLAGFISANADVSGKITDAGTILKNSFYGQVAFQLDNGAIYHFAPFEKLSRFIFKKRGLDSVVVKDLHGQFDVRGSKVFIRPMDIQTSALDMAVQGVYGLGGGTDIFISVPLRNPSKEKAKTPLGKLLRRGKGIVLHLRAQDPSGDGVKIGWDPLRRGRDATENILDQQTLSD